MQLLNILETNFSTAFWTFLDYIDQTIKWHRHYLRFTPNPDCNHDWRRTFSLGTTSRCSPPSPWPVPRLRDPGIGASAKPGHQTTPSKTQHDFHAWNLHNEKGTFSPQTKQQKQCGSSQEKRARTFFQCFFIALAAKVLSFHLLVANGELANRWKNRLSWSLFVSDVKKFDRFQITSVVDMKKLLRLVFIQYLIFIYSVYICDVYLSDV